MSRARTCVGVATVLLLFAGSAFGEEQQIKVEQVPAKALETVKARFKGASLTNAAKETENGELVYEVTVKLNGKTSDVTVSPAGELQMIETLLDAKALPPAAAKALEAKYPKASWRSVEEIVEVHGGRESLSVYEVLLRTADNRTVEVKVAPDGTSVTESSDDEGEESGEEEDEADENPGGSR